MSGYIYADRQLREWPAPAQAAALWERASHLEAQANYWKHRAESAEQRMTEHDCQEGTA